MKKINMLLASFGVFGSSIIAAEPKPAKPNILLILADDLGFSDIGCYGSEIHTPNIDRLATQGVRFTHVYNSAKCEPTRASLMSGQYWQECGLGVKQGITMGQAMRGAGYATLAIGKWHLDGNPVERGFDHYFGHLSGASDYFKGNPTHRLDLAPFIPPKDGTFYTTDANAEYEGKPLKPIPGKSLRPIFSGEQRTPHEALYFQLFDHRAIIVGDYKLVSDWNRPWQLFNHSADRTELNDLSLTQPKRVLEMEKMWNNWSAKSGADKKFGSAGGEPVYRHLNDLQEKFIGGKNSEGNDEGNDEKIVVKRKKNK